MVDQEPIDAELAALAQRKAPLEEKANILRAEVAQARPRSTPSWRRPGGAGRRGGAAPDRALRALRALRARLKGTGAARLIGHRCDGCHLELSRWRSSASGPCPPDTVVTCDQCGRILVPT
jgi:hypothetical protein